MTNKSMTEVVHALIDELLTYPAGTEISTADLLAKMFPEIYHELDTKELFAIDGSLFKEAKKCNLYLDKSKYGDMPVGLPFNLDFAVYQKKTGKKCPRCGSRDTASILYGDPAFDEQMEADIQNHRIAIGGCCISDIDPKYHCFSCKKNFGTPPILISKHGMESYKDIVTEFKFECGGYLSGYRTVRAFKKENSYFLEVTSMGYIEKEKEITEAEWQEIIKKLYENLLIHEWKKSYYDPCVLDGTQWSIDIKLTNRRKRSYWGSNAYPAYWTEMERWVKNITR